MDSPDVDEATPSRVGLRKPFLIAAVAVVVVLVDQLSKSWAVSRLSPEGSPGIHLVWTFRFRLAFNSGMAFSRGQGKGALIGGLVIAVVIALAWFARSVNDRPSLICIGLIMGGALGNLVDRLFRAGVGFLGGRVVDFAYVGWWPTFNVADACVVVGGIGLALLLMRKPDTQT